MAFDLTEIAVESPFRLRPISGAIHRPSSALVESLGWR
jgi:hypothetical protein